MASALSCGFLIALFYDIYWLLTAGKRRPVWLRLMQDILFWLAVFCVVAALWLYFMGGVLRLAVYLWLAAGALLFHYCFSRRLRRLRLPRLKTVAVPAPAHAFKQRFLSLPPALMLKAGLGFWQGWAWLKSHWPKEEKK